MRHRGAAQPGRVRWRLGWSAAFGVVIALGCVIGAWAYWLWSSEPAHWRDNQAYLDSQPAAELEAMAETFEQRISRSLLAAGPSDPAGPRGGAARPTPHAGPSAAAHAPDPNAPDAEAPPGTQELTMTVQEVNAWLATRLEPWLAHQNMALPELVSRPMVAFDGEQLVVAFRYRSPQVTQVVSLYLDLELLPDGRMSARLDSATGGRLPVPLQSLLEGRAEAEAGGTSSGGGVASGGGGGGGGDGVERLRRVLEGEPFEPLLPLDAARSARVVGYRIDGDRLVLTVRKLREPGRTR